MKSDLDMKTPIFNRQQVNDLINGFKLLDMSPAEMPRDWTCMLVLALSPN